MRYPMINNWLVFKRLNKYKVETKDCLCDDEYILEWNIACLQENSMAREYMICSGKAIFSKK